MALRLETFRTCRTPISWCGRQQTTSRHERSKPVSGATCVRQAVHRLGIAGGLANLRRQAGRAEGRCRRRRLGSHCSARWLPEEEGKRDPPRPTNTPTHPGAVTSNSRPLSRSCLKSDACWQPVVHRCVKSLIELIPASDILNPFGRCQPHTPTRPTGQQLPSTLRPR